MQKKPPKHIHSCCYFHPHSNVIKYIKKTKDVETGDTFNLNRKAAHRVIPGGPARGPSERGGAFALLKSCERQATSGPLLCQREPSQLSGGCSCGAAQRGEPAPVVCVHRANGASWPLLQHRPDH